MKILYIENHALFAENVINQFLSHHTVAVAPSLSAARKALDTGNFDLLLVDYDLDDGKGDALVKELHASILVGALLTFLLFITSTVSLHIIIWSWWCLRGRDVLFVYSDSPVWHDYVEQHIMPQLGERAVILNWSKRRRWRFSLAKMAFCHFGGYGQFNPLGVVFRPFRSSKEFRFWQPFRDFKHGHPEALHRMESDFFGYIGVPRNDLST
jgi:hypothetical protein